MWPRIAIATGFLGLAALTLVDHTLGLAGWIPAVAVAGAGLWVRYGRRATLVAVVALAVLAATALFVFAFTPRYSVLPVAAAVLRVPYQGVYVYRDQRWTLQHQVTVPTEDLSLTGLQSQAAATTPAQWEAGLRRLMSAEGWASLAGASGTIVLSRDDQISSETGLQLRLVQKLAVPTPTIESIWIGPAAGSRVYLHAPQFAIAATYPPAGQPRDLLMDGLWEWPIDLPGEYGSPGSPPEVRVETNAPIMQNAAAAWLLSVTASDLFRWGASAFGLIVGTIFATEVTRTRRRIVDSIRRRVRLPPATTA